MDPKSPNFSMDSGSPMFFDAQFQNSVDNTGYLYSPSAGYGISSLSQTSPRMPYAPLGGSYDYYSGSASATRPYTPPLSISPPLTNLSASEMSGDGMSLPSAKRRGSSNGSPSPTTPNSLVHRHARGSVSGPATRATANRKRRARADDESDDDDDDGEFRPGSMAETTEMSGDTRIIQKRREEIRRQRIESEQRRRDELRDGYRRLKDVLPVSNQKSSKVSLLERATNHIKFLEVTQQQLQQRLASAESETQRLRHVNEKLMLGAAEHNQQIAAAAAANHTSY